MDKHDILEKFQKLMAKYLIYIFIILIIIVLIILFIPTKSIEDKAIDLAKKHIKSNRIIITEVDTEISFENIGLSLDSSCYESGLVLVSTSGYKVLYICNNTPSKDMQSMINTNQFTLMGTNPYFVKLGTTYIEPSYYLDGDDFIVKKSGTVGNKIGMYLLKYEAVGNGKTLKTNRIVVVTGKNFQSYPTITLKGDFRVNVLKGKNYEEAGYEAYDAKDGNITRNVRIEGNVDVNKVGRYVLKYVVLNSSGRSAEMYRYVNVVSNTAEADFEIIPSTTSYTNKEVTLKIVVTGEGYDFMLDHDGNINTLNEFYYKVTENDEYTFSLKKKDGSVVEKSINISNIDKTKPTGSCKSVVTNNQTSIIVTANDNSGIKKYIYSVGTYSNESTSNTYTINSSIKSAMVTIYDYADNSNTVSCSIDDKTTNAAGIIRTLHYQTLKYDNINCIIYYPEDLDLSVKNPLVIFLHGDGETGTNVSRLSELVFVKKMKSGEFKNAIYMAPQRPGGSYWNPYLKTVKSLIDEVVDVFNVDTKKISITGHSSGGIGVYTFVSQNPDMFSAAVVLSGRNKDGAINNLLSTPIRHYHGTEDVNVAYQKGKESATKIKNAGGNIEFISLQGMYHAITSHVYNKTDAIEWMLAQSR